MCILAANCSDRIIILLMLCEGRNNKIEGDSFSIDPKEDITNATIVF